VSFIVGILSFYFFSLSGSYVDDELIVWFTPDTRAKIESIASEKYDGNVLVAELPLKSDLDKGFDHLNSIYGAKSIKRLLCGKITSKAQEYELDLLYIIKFGKSIDPLSIAEEYKRLDIVKDAFPNWKKKVYIEPNDPYFGPDFWTEEWYLFKINAPQAWDITQGDTTIAVGPVDTGVDWEHPDLRNELWVNPGEDLNGNGVFDYPDDLNNVDDDGNGYIDDIIGFNFVSYNWNPAPTEPGNDHGTHVFGIIAASTNNGLGIASVGWKVRGMAFKCGDGNYVYLSAAINAIYYAANHGAVATNHSYGGSYSSGEASAIAYAHSMGVTVCAAAGNEGWSLISYPAGYENVIAVAATGYDDSKTDFSNYGNWVDVASPGTSIWSTVPGGNYAAFDGTSMASPIVCGIAALIRSLHPDWTSFQVDSAIMWGCDNIDSLNPNYVGQLGWGRVNAWNSLALTLYSHLKITDYYFDGDGRPEPGETVNMSIKLTNLHHWLDANDISLNLSSPDPDIEIIDGTETLSFLENGDTVLLENAFTFSVSGDIRFSELIISYTSTPQSGNEEDTIRILIGYPDIVLVNDAGNEDFVTHYRNVLDELSLVYEELDADEGELFSLVEPPRSVVIWLTGNDSLEVLSQEEIDTLINYLSSGGSLFISSQYLAEDQDASQLREDWLKAGVVTLSNSRRVMRGYEGDPIGDSLYIKLYGPGGAANCISPDELEPLGNSFPVLYYTAMNGSGNYGPGAIRYDSGQYKTVYFAFPFEAIDDLAQGRNTKEDVIIRIFNWFGYNINIDEKLMASINPIEQIVLYPNPFNGSFKISLSLKGEQKLEFKIFDSSGRFVKTIQRGSFPRGDHILSIRVKDLTDGVYFLKIDGMKKSQIIKIVKTGR
jgi:subtilisin family serine protease